jgi:signal transduction histidine kinase
MRIRDIKIGTKQAIAFGLILSLMAIAGIVTLLSMQSIKVSIDQASEIWLPRAITISELSLFTNDLRRQQVQLTVTAEPELQEELKGQIVDTIDKINAARDRYDELRAMAAAAGLYFDRERELYDSFDRQWESYQDLTLAWIMLLRDEREGAASHMLTEDARRRAEEFRDNLRELVAISSEESQKAASAAEIAYQRTHRLTKILSILAVGLSVVFIVALIRVVAYPIKNLAAAACRVAAGDLEVRLESTGKDEVGVLADSFNQMTESLRDSRMKTRSQEAALRRQNSELEDALMRLKETQQQLVLREKMASLGNLVAGVAHEINNPTGAVNSSSDNSRRALQKLDELFASMQLPELSDDPRFLHIMEALQENNNVTTMAGLRIAQIVKSLKNFARLDEAEYQRADIHVGLDSTLTLLHHELKNRVEVIREYGEIPLVKCYPNQLNQVFMNLLINATQAIQARGTIRIKTLRDGEHVEISVEDDGRGIKAENLDRIFDPGFTTKGVGVGTGLGLSISYNIIKKHQGEIFVESQVGKGSTFTIRLPVDPARKQVSEDKSDQSL